MDRGEAVSLESIVSELKRFARRLSSIGIGLRSLVLFGSWARGEQLCNSDVDVLIVADGFEKMPFYERIELVERLYDGRLLLEPWCYTPREILEALGAKPRLDVIDALEYGIVVYDDGFWERVKRVTPRFKRGEAGGVLLEG